MLYWRFVRHESPVKESQINAPRTLGSPVGSHIGLRFLSDRNANTVNRCYGGPDHGRANCRTVFWSYVCSIGDCSAHQST